MSPLSQLYFLPSILFTKSSNLCTRYRHDTTCWPSGKKTHSNHAAAASPFRNTSTNGNNLELFTNSFNFRNRSNTRTQRGGEIERQPCDASSILRIHLWHIIPRCSARTFEIAENASFTVASHSQLSRWALPLAHSRSFPGLPVHSLWK